MINRSMYSQIMQNESRKIKAVSGVLCDLDLSLDEEARIVELYDIAQRERIELYLQKREREYYRRCRYCGGYEREVVYDYISDVPTNIYKFANQSFADNLSGRSNIDITNIHKNDAAKKSQLNRILERCGRNVRGNF